ncbi:MAG: ABC transporter permease, partial [Bacteroidales bacterium]
MRFDIDRFREIADTLRRNKSRTILTGFGVFWGIFMLLALLGSSNGVQGLLGMNFEGFASNSTFVMGQTTSKPYKGFKRGRSIQFKLKDLD